MPTYEFRCPDGSIVERVFKMSDVPAEIPAPDGSGMAVRIVSAGAGLLFKGSGFYITDYGKDGKKDQRAQSEKQASSSEKSEGAKSESATSDGAKSDGAKSDSAKSDSAKSDSAKSDGGKPEGAKSESSKGDSGPAGAGKADTGAPAAAKSDGAPSKKDAPSTPAAPKSDPK